MSDLTKCYGPVAAVRGVSFEARTGEILGLVGPNGAGKTTTLECILGLRRPDAGAIEFNGLDALAQPEAARRRIGAQLQAAALQDGVTPRQILRLFGSFYSQPANPAGLLEQFGLVDKADAAFATLSGGQRQRLFLALALVNDPLLVVLDEPTAGLDPLSRRALHDCIRRLRAAGRTILLSTHRLDEAEEMCDRVAIIDRGRLVAVDTPAAVIGLARVPARVRVTTARPLTAADLRHLPGVVAMDPVGEGWLLGTTGVTRTVVGLTKLLETETNELLDLQILRPSLEDAFFDLTGRSWPAAAKN